MHGTIFLTILPPKNCFRPFLLSRTKSGKVVQTLCAKCAENSSNSCHHTDSQRALSSCYFISEINAALNFDYKIIHIYECHYYKNVSYILKDFVTKLNVQKIKHSDLFKNCNNLKEKNDICDSLNSKMHLEPPFNVTMSNVKINERKRFLYKQFANSFFGKFNQNSNKPQTIFVRSQKCIDDLFYSEDKITDLFCLNESICQVEIIKNVQKKNLPNLKTNCYIGGEIVSYSRQIIYEYMNQIECNGGTIYQVECDSIIFSLPNNVQMPIPISNCLGEFKQEIEGEILSYHSFGPKNYSITYKEQNNAIKTITKISGLSLKNALFKNELSENLFIEFLNNFETLQNKCLSQVRTKRKKFEITSTLEQCTYSNNLTKKRYVKKTDNHLIMYPFGY